MVRTDACPHLSLSAGNKFKTRKSRFLNSEERRLLKRQQDHCPVCFSSRIHVYAERLPSGRPVAGCRACNRLFSLG